MRRVIETLAANTKPRDGTTLIKRFAEMHFDNCSAGVQRRRRNLGMKAFESSQLRKLEHLKDSFYPIKSLIESSTRTRAEALRVPAKGTWYPPRRSCFQWEAWAKTLRFILFGLFGFRALELGKLKVDDGRLYLWQIKSKRDLR